MIQNFGRLILEDNILVNDFCHAAFVILSQLKFEQGELMLVFQIPQNFVSSEAK